MLDVPRSQVPQVPSHWAVKRAFWWLRCQKVAVFFAETVRTSKKGQTTSKIVAASKALWWRIEAALDMQIRARLLQGAL
jgi:hypothetical protein